MLAQKLRANVYNIIHKHQFMTNQMLQASTYVCDIEYYKVTTHAIAFSLRF